MLESSLDLEILGFFFSGNFGPFFQKNPLQKLQWISYVYQEAKKFNTSKNADCQGLKPLGEYQTL
jgi:hypothetical protein